MRTYNINDIHLSVDELIIKESNEGYIFINWSSDIGFGTYTIRINNDGSIIGDSETMDSNEDKEFIKKLFELITEKIQIK